MSSSYTLDKAELIGAIGETVLYGFYLLSMFPATCFVLYKNRQSMGKPLGTSVWFIASVFLFFLVTAHWIVDMSRLYDAFITTQPEPPVRFYARLSEPRSVMRIVLFVSEVVTLDLLLLYRLYIVWGRNYWVVIIPFLTLITTTVSVIRVSIGFANAVLGENLFFTSTGTWIITAFTLTLVTNIMAVGLMAFKILRRDRAFKDSGVKSLAPILVVIIEGAGLYCAINFISMVGIVVQSNANFTSLAFSSPITGISFCLITLRVGLGRAISDFVGAHGTTAPLSRGSGRGPQLAMRVQVTRDEFSTAEPHSGIELSDLESSHKGTSKTWDD